MTPSSSVASTSTAISNTSSSKVAKRKRVSRACDQCYQKKDKCDGLTPVCTFCAQSERKCTYDRPERKRGPTQGLRPRLEQRILALETVLGFVLGQLKHERVKIDVDQLKNAGQADKAKFRKQGWLYSDVKQELVDVLGLEGDLVSMGTTLAATTNAELRPSPSSAAQPQQKAPNEAQAAGAEEEEDGEGEEADREGEEEGEEGEEDDYTDSDYSEVDLALPSTHTHAPHPYPFQSESSASTPHHHDHHDHPSSSSLTMSIPHGLPLLSSGKGGSSLNRGLVPRGADPNAVLGGFTIEFGGNQTDEDWIRRFVPPSSSTTNTTASPTHHNHHSAANTIAPATKTTRRNPSTSEF
ncbi:uncharacterized protein MEPE_02726 [Melanopsichium pennsylvanicum]|uniref:Zn(2)-C6 fungal-type domain-containing protein n=1 Tax=Melanopsichium pennsylvanicum TaxID=63383 RepID=A0AAJ4XKY8_9BASI|nr:uncharacterized protein MEPE_02726 [Melanopsichium pennsylvanicum]